VARRLVLVVAALLVTLSLGGCGKEFCKDRSLVGFLFCDPALVEDDSVGPRVHLYSHHAENADNVAVYKGDTLGFSLKVEGADDPFYPAGYVAREEWDLDDDGTYEIVLTDGAGTGRHVHKFFAHAGKYTVRARVTDLEGNPTDAHMDITVLPRPSPETSPRASFTMSPNPAIPGEPVQFDASASSDPDGQIVEYHWDILHVGYGGRTMSHAFGRGEIGTFEVRLTVTDDDGLTGRLTLPLTIVDRDGPFDPVASFIATPHDTHPREVLFDATGSSDRDGYIVEYLWDLDGDGTHETHAGPSFSTTYPSDGTYDVDLIVRDNDNRVGRYNASVKVRARYPEVTLTASPNPARAGEVVRFEAYISTPGRVGVDHLWYLTDAGPPDIDTDERSFAEWTYRPDQTGNIDTEVVVTDQYGLSNFDHLEMRVFEGHPSAPTSAARARRPAARRFFARLDTQAFSTRGARASRNRAGRSIRGVTAAGTIHGRLLPDRRHAGSVPAAPATLAALLDARWVTRVDLASLVRGRRQSVTGVALATPRRRELGRACLRLTIKRRGKRPPVGTYEVIGGTGPAARLRARGRFGFELRSRGGAALAGTVRASTGAPRRLPRACAVAGAG
jgi:PKD repeat protein